MSIICFDLISEKTGRTGSMLIFLCAISFLILYLLNKNRIFIKIELRRFSEI